MALRDSSGLRAPHRLDDVVERQGEAAAQLDHQGFFPLRHRRAQPVRPGRAVGDVVAGFPPGDGAAVDAEFAGERSVVRLALLDVGAGARGGGGVGVQFEIYHPVLPSIGRLQHRDRVRGTLAPVGPQVPPARRPAKLAGVAARARGSLPWTTGTSCASSRSRRNSSTACHSRVLSRQSFGTEHLRRGRLYAEASWRARSALCPAFGSCRAADPRPRSRRSVVATATPSAG